MVFNNDAKRLFGTTNLYEILQLHGSKKVRQNYTREEIKKAYLKLTLKYHPDRCYGDNEKVEATQKFQILNKAYSILDNKEKRKIYDDTGVINDEEICYNDVDLSTLWKAAFKKITKADLESYIKEYRESGEEREDVKKSYENHKGDMGKIMNDIIGVSFEDEDRIRNMINEMIENGELKLTKSFVNESRQKRAKRQKAAKKEAKEAAKMLKEIEEKEGSKSLVALIQDRQKNKMNGYDKFCDELAAKYCNKPASRKRKAS